uniref:Ig-like domain-containing protein n=1 Tax=Cyprinus carpio carpio TaxID=630221 RepID=A0A9J7XLK6_CYPCA
MDSKRICFSGSRAAEITVTQTPSVKTATPGENVVMSCKLSKDSTCGPPCVAWYLQKPGEALKLLIYDASSRQSGTSSRFNQTQNYTCVKNPPEISFYSMGQ